MFSAVFHLHKWNFSFKAHTETPYTVASENQWEEVNLLFQFIFMEASLLCTSHSLICIIKECVNSSITLEIHDGWKGFLQNEAYALMSNKGSKALQWSAWSLDLTVSGLI